MAKRYRAIYKPTPEHRFVPGIPAHDLTPDEVELYGGVDLLRNAQCYVLESVGVEPVGVEPTLDEDDDEELDDGC
jgi:hypothetical protein